VASLVPMKQARKQRSKDHRSPAPSAAELRVRTQSFAAGMDFGVWLFGR